MQTKNINLNQEAQNSRNNSIIEKTHVDNTKNSCIMTPTSATIVVIGQSSNDDSNSDIALTSPAPPLPPRGHTTQHLYHARLVQAEVDGYGPYKPVPPPKPLSGAPSGGGYSPPPYRMPPYPLYGETAIPGAAGNDNASNTALHTHSSKFPIEREVILSSTDKNSKIPILNEYKKWSKTASAAIAPDGPAKQVAWTEEKKIKESSNRDENQLILTRVQHSYRTDQSNFDNMGMDETGHPIYQARSSLMHENNRPQKMPHPQSQTNDYRPAYAQNGHQGGVSTGAVPRTWGNRGDDSSNRHVQHYHSSHISSRPPAALPQDMQRNSENQATLSESSKRDPSCERKVEGKEEDDEDRNNVENAGNSENAKDGASKDLDKSKTFSSRTLHSIKDIISSRFSSTKGLNKDGGSESVGDCERNKEFGQTSSSALNNNDVTIKSVSASPRKMQRENIGDGQNSSHTVETDINQRQQILATPQVIGPSRNYGDSHGMNRAYPTQGRRNVAESQGIPLNRGTEVDDATRRSGRGKGGPLDHGVYATARIAHQEQVSRSIGDFSRELPPQPSEPIYGYHGQRVGQANKVTVNSRMPSHFGSQPGLLDQSGIYMVMRQNTGNSQQQPYNSQTSDCINQAGTSRGQVNSHIQIIENGRRSEYESAHQSTIHQINEARKLALEGKSLLERDNQNGSEANSQTLPRDMQKRDTRIPSRRGSQTHLDDDDDEGGFLSNDRTVGKSIHDNHSSGGENFINQGGAGSCTSGSYSQQQSSGQSSDYEKATQRSIGQSSSNADSGRGSTVYSSGRQLMSSNREDNSERLDTSTDSPSSDSPQAPGRRDNIYGIPATAGNDSEWVDIVESELRQILDPKLHGLSLSGSNAPGANSTLSESISSLTPPLPPLSPDGGSSPAMTPRNSGRYKLGPSSSYSLPYGSKLDYNEGVKHGETRKGAQGGGAISKSHHSRGGNTILGNSSGNRGGWSSRNGKGQSSTDKQHRQMSSSKKMELLGSSSKGGKVGLSASAFGLDSTDLTSTTTGLDSMLDGNTENNSSDDDLSTTIDANDAHAIRKQLEGLENMYSEVLKLLGVKKYGGRYQPSDPRISKRRLYGSMSSLPSSVSSRPIRDKRRQDDRKKVKDIKGINKRFQRLESHVVTLARSVAHLSSEMRTQHLMIQEMENIRGEIAALRTQTLAVRSQSIPRGLGSGMPGDRDIGLPALTNPSRVKKLTKFFGDEPPLLRLFLKKLGYEKYAGSFENERIGMVELPYLTEERLQKMGIPLGPRLRILQEAQISVCRDKVYVV